MLMVSPSLMVLKAHVITSGHLLQLILRQLLYHLLNVLVPCNTDESWSFEVPEFVANNYFCDTGNPGPDVGLGVYTDDPLWDGEGCGPTSTCCEFKNPPWFCTALPQPTTDDIEARICLDSFDEGVIVNLVDIYVM